MVDDVVKVCFKEPGDLQCRKKGKCFHYHLLLSSMALSCSVLISILYTAGFHRNRPVFCSYRWPCSHVMLQEILDKMPPTTFMHGIHKCTAWKSLWIKVSVSSRGHRSAGDHGIETHSSWSLFFLPRRQVKPLNALYARRPWWSRSGLQALGRVNFPPQRPAVCTSSWQPDGCGRPVEFSQRTTLRAFVGKKREHNH